MCGICVIFQPKTDLTPETVTKMVQTLSHRGPDDKGVVILRSNQFPDGDEHIGDVGLGHTRLSIIDLSPAGHQPMRRRENGPIITFNGEIYNYRELRQILEREGVTFNSDSDTEVLLAAYENWSYDMLHRLNGMFAFAIWDPTCDEMFVARDRLGIKPLYYYECQGCFVCTSELKTLWAYPHFKAELNLDALGQYLIRGYVPAPATIFQHVHKLPPGHFLRVRSGHPVQIEQYWDPLPYYQQVSVKDEVEAQTELDNLLQSSVVYRMISDVPLGGLLSGGIDSSLVVALMQEQSQRPIKTFTIAFDMSNYNEAKYARAVAEHLGTEHHELVVNEHNLLELVPNLALYYDEPFADMSAIPTYAVSTLARQNVTVALSGDGGDETHLGYSTYRWMEKREYVHRWIPSPFIHLSTNVLERIPRRQAQRLSAYLRFETPLEAHQWAVSYWPGMDAQSLLNNHSNNRFYQTSYEYTLERLQDIDLLQRMAAADLTSYMVDDILTKVDRASMAVALEVRVPLLDHRVVEYVAGLPLAMKRRQGISKYLLRKLLYKRVPQALVDRPKQGFNVPMAQWLRGPLKDLLRATLTPSKLREHDLFNVDTITQLVEEHITNKQDHSKKLWNILVFQMWYNRYLA